MAQKKITDLQLIDAVVSSLSVPSDDGIQSYRFTAAQMKSFILANENILLSMLKADIFNGLTSVSAADDDYFILNDTSDSNNTKKALVSTFVRNLYRAVSTYPATITSADGTLKLSGSSGTITLPANGSPGKKYKLIHGGTSLSQVYTIATTGGAVFKTPSGDISSGSYKLFTFGEVVEFEDDGTNWEQVNHYAKTPWTDFPTQFTSGNLITGVSGNPAPATTTQVNKARYRRDGSDLLFKFDYSHSSNSGSAVGSGLYLLSLADFGTIKTSINAVYTGANYYNFLSSSIGIIKGSDTSNAYIGGITAYSTTQLRAMFNYTGSSQGVQSWGSSGGPFNATQLHTSLEGRVTITDWLD